VESQLLSLSKVFTEKLFRIPDYQRGYAWSIKQLSEFWNDITNLGENQNHYYGVITVEKVPEPKLSEWSDDLWIINSKSYSAYYVVDGQQRLTTAIILIQSILEQLQEEDSLNYTCKADIRKKFIFERRDASDLNRSYLFGYEKDNPSYNYLKSMVFGEDTTVHTLPEETIYTKNLLDAKHFFTSSLVSLSRSELEGLYKKITQNLLVTIYTITQDIDVFIAFETMNNRGKRLSNLELLKNRLIYFSTKLPEDAIEKDALRARINEGWKSIYHYLGKNKQNPLDDDEFLAMHYSIYFDNKTTNESPDLGHRYFLNREGYIGTLLLDNIYSIKTLQGSELNSAPTKSTINEYVTSLKNAVEVWFALNNPQVSNLEAELQQDLDRILRLDPRDDASMLVLSFLLKEPLTEKRIKFLRLLEKRLFIGTFINIRYYNLPQADRDKFAFAKLANDLHSGRSSSADIIKTLSHNIITDESIKAYLTQAKKSYQKYGYYGWHGLRYFLFEYEMDLQYKSKTDRQKLFWPEFGEDKADYHTIEHIYPQRPRAAEWVNLFEHYSPQERTILRHSLGNLLPLSKGKNSSLGNKPFSSKKGSKESTVGYRFGSYSEVEISNIDEWNAGEIRKRGIRMLTFLEKRWDIPLGDEKSKLEWLGLKGIAM
jgi:uncharacterized protein with ParB-like and HNH nuclease domain